MKFNQRTLSLAAAWMAGWGSVALADNHMMSQVSKTTISGYVDTSAIWAIGSDGNANFPGRTNDGAGRVDGFNLNVVQLSLEKPLDESEWASGYRVDMWMGPDSQWLNNYSAFGGGGNDFSLKQAYVAVRAPVGNGLDLKLGVFDTVIGYEVANSPANPNFSRSYGFFIQPFQHTGVLASYQITDELSISGGVANTFASGINDRVDAGNLTGGTGSESQKTYMAAITYNIPENFGFVGGGAIYAGFVDGLDGGPEERTNYYIGATIPTPVDGLALGIAFDYANDLTNLGYDQGLGLRGIQDEIEGHFYYRKDMMREDGTYTYVGNEWWRGSREQQFDAYTIAGYLSYQVTEKMTFNGRIDYLNIELDTWSYALDSDGYPVEVDVLENGEVIGTTHVATGNDRDVELLSLTGTIDYSLWENVLSRLEVRWDHSLDYDLFGGNSYDGTPDENDAVTIALNMIYQF